MLGWAPIGYFYLDPLVDGFNVWNDSMRKEIEIHHIYLPEALHGDTITPCLSTIIHHNLEALPS